MMRVPEDTPRCRFAAAHWRATHFLTKDGISSVGDNETWPSRAKVTLGHRKSVDEISDSLWQGLHPTAPEVDSTCACRLRTIAVSGTCSTAIVPLRCATSGPWGRRTRARACIPVSIEVGLGFSSWRLCSILPDGASDHAEPSLAALSQFWRMLSALQPVISPSPHADTYYPTSPVDCPNRRGTELQPPPPTSNTSGGDQDRRTTQACIGGAVAWADATPLSASLASPGTPALDMLAVEDGELHKRGASQQRQGQFTCIRMQSIASTRADQVGRSNMFDPRFQAKSSSVWSRWPGARMAHIPRPMRSSKENRLAA